MKMKIRTLLYGVAILGFLVIARYVWAWASLEKNKLAFCGAILALCGALFFVYQLALSLRRKKPEKKG